MRGQIDEKVDQIIERVDEINDKIESIPPRQLEKIKDQIQEKLDAITDAQREAIADAVKQRINDRIDEIKGDADAIRDEIRKAAEAAIGELNKTASKKVKKALEEAEAQLAAAIEDGMKQAADADIESGCRGYPPSVLNPILSRSMWRGAPRTSRRIRTMYSPMTPSDNNMIPEENETMRLSVVQPATCILSVR